MRELLLELAKGNLNVHVVARTGNFASKEHEVFFIKEVEISSRGVPVLILDS